MRFGTLILGISLLLPGYALACDDAPKFNKGDRTWIKTDLTVYGLSKKGQLFEMQLPSGKTQVLATHPFSSARYLGISPDRRYVVYQGEVGGDDGPYYLYDIKSKTDRVVPDSAEDSYRPVFSPSSGKMLRYTSSAALMTDVTSLESDAISLPPGFSDPMSWLLEADWSQAGDAVYLTVATRKSMSTAAYDLSGYAYDLKTRQYTQIDVHEQDYSRAGKELPTFEQPRIQSQEGGAGGADKTSPSGRWAASIQKDHSLVIKDSSGKSVLVDKGGDSFCEGEAAVPMAWLSDDYLLFRLHDIPNVYGVKEGKKKVFFDPREVEFFFW